MTRSGKTYLLVIELDYFYENGKKMVNKFSIHEVGLVQFLLIQILESAETVNFHIPLETLNLKKEKK